jgi:hypothetical protein
MKLGALFTFAAMEYYAVIEFAFLLAIKANGSGFALLEIM